ncbi:hypothetical protein ADK38_32530, partial [Streptomyces varsoviensis]
GSLDAVDWATDAAVRRGLPLRVVHASLWEPYGGLSLAGSPEGPTDREAQETITAAGAERAVRRAPGLKVLTHVASADPVTTLLAQSEDAAFVVVGCRGRGGLVSALLGSVSLALAARATCPVIVVRGRPENIGGALGRVVVGVGERPAEATVEFAFAEAELRRCEVAAVHAWRCAGEDVPEEHGPHGGRRAEHERRAQALLDSELRGALAAHPKVPLVSSPIESSAREALLTAAA